MKSRTKKRVGWWLLQFGTLCFLFLLASSQTVAVSLSVTVVIGLVIGLVYRRAYREFVCTVQQSVGSGAFRRTAAILPLFVATLAVCVFESRQILGGLSSSNPILLAIVLYFLVGGCMVFVTLY